MKVGIVLRPSSPDILDLYLKVEKAFKKHNTRVYLDTNSAKMIGLIGIEFDRMCNECDILVSIGGDGTLISLARRSYKYNKPIMGINAGKLGFLTDVSISEIDKFIDKFFKKLKLTYTGSELQSKLALIRQKVKSYLNQNLS